MFAHCITTRDLLRGRLQIALERLVRCDICDPDEDFAEVRQDARCKLREIEAEARKSGLEFADLYTDVAYDVESLADFEAERDALEDVD